MRATADHIQKAAEKVDYEARRVMIDQNRKLIANIDNVIATSNNAIAAIWHSHWRRPGYDFREDHKARSVVLPDSRELGAKRVSESRCRVSR